MRGRRRRKGPGGSWVTSSCSWLGQEASSVLRETGPSSTERTLSANFREHSVSLVFFSAGETCGQAGAESRRTGHLHTPRAPLPQQMHWCRPSEMLLLTCRSRDSPVHLHQGRRLSQPDPLSPTALAHRAAGKCCSRWQGLRHPRGAWWAQAGRGTGPRTGMEQLPEH